MKHLSAFIHSFDFIHAKPAPDWISANFGSIAISALALEGKDYIAYIGDARETTDQDAGQPLGGNISFPCRRVALPSVCILPKAASILRPGA